MTAVAASCPNCGAAIAFRWAQAVQATCEYCRSVLVRHDLDLEKVGTSAVVPLTPSPLQLGSEGSWRGEPFTVVGRLVYQWERGGWSEWHLRLGTDASAWLSDAQAEYAVTTQVTPESELPLAECVTPGASIIFHHVKYIVTTMTKAHYVGTEGELPFTSWDRQDVTFADLRSETGGFATIDYSESPPLLFTGEAVELSQLSLRKLRSFEGW